MPSEWMTPLTLVVPTSLGTWVGGWTMGIPWASVYFLGVNPNLAMMPMSKAANMRPAAW